MYQFLFIRPKIDLSKSYVLFIQNYCFLNKWCTVDRLTYSTRKETIFIFLLKINCKKKIDCRISTPSRLEESIAVCRSVIQHPVNHRWFRRQRVLPLGDAYNTHINHDISSKSLGYIYFLFFYRLY